MQENFAFFRCEVNDAVLNGLHQEISEVGAARAELANCLESMPLGAKIEATGVWECLKRPTVEMFEEWFNKVQMMPYKVKRYFFTSARTIIDEQIDMFPQNIEYAEWEERGLGPGVFLVQGTRQKKDKVKTGVVRMIL